MQLPLLLHLRRLRLVMLLRLNAKARSAVAAAVAPDRVIDLRSRLPNSRAFNIVSTRAFSMQTVEMQAEVFVQSLSRWGTGMQRRAKRRKEKREVQHAVNRSRQRAGFKLTHAKVF
jgi:hypothetical protein